MKAPFCPISRGQKPVSKLPMRQQTIPIATDLPSLIKSVNILREVLVNISTSRVVNNTYLPKQPRDPKILPNKTYVMSPYPTWYQKQKDVVDGFVYHKSKSGKDAEQRTYIERTNAVEFRNNEIDNDNPFIWRYRRPLDSEYGEKGPVFEEDFFERVVNVHWGKKELEYFGIGWTMALITNSAVIYSYGPPCGVPDGEGVGFTGSFSCNWRWAIIQEGKMPGAIYSGKPSGTGGSMGRYILPHAYPNPPYGIARYVTGTEVVWPPNYSPGLISTYNSCQIIAQGYGNVLGCWGNEIWPNPYTGEPQYDSSYGYRGSRYTIYDLGTIPGSNITTPLTYDLIGSTAISANITAVGADDGKPLKLEEQHINIFHDPGQSYSAASVYAMFSRPKKKKKKS